MKIGRFLAALMILVSSSAWAPALADCKLMQLAVLPVTMSGLRPMVATQINGIDSLFIADSGAFFSMISPASAVEFKLKLRPAPWGLRVHGIGGEVETSTAIVDDFKLADIPLHNLTFLVGGSEPGSGAAGLLGQNVLGIGDVEYDLAHGVIKIMRPGDGCRKADLAYWVTSEPYSVIDIKSATAASPQTTSSAFVNGTWIKVLFDTGAATSILGLRAAKRAGVTPDGAGVIRAGASHGLGQRSVETWIAPISSFKIGGEEIHDTRLQIGDIGPDADMLLGADFFLAHHIYVSNRQDKLYFTYNGGPVFNLSQSPLAQGSTAPLPEGPPHSKEGSEEPTDAAAFSRRGTAYAARLDFEHAIADLSRACELEPNEAKYFYERGLARWNNKQAPLAMADFDQALKLKPDDLATLVMRARLRLALQDSSAASSDLDAADRLAPKEANVRLAIAQMYSQLGQLAPALAQYDLWIAAHPQDAGLATAMNGRCWTRALWGNELDKALADCNAAHKLSRKSAEILDSRGLVRLRLGDFDASIADYDEALRLQPRSAWSLYGRGLGKLRKGMSIEGQNDIAAATALQPGIADDARKYGIAP
jgi:tetratricopeptide (TPR) repeat protein/predicted aspartyl protease